jgi:hypothetical protein
MGAREQPGLHTVDLSNNEMEALPSLRELCYVQVQLPHLARGRCTQ